MSLSCLRLSPLRVAVVCADAERLWCSNNNNGGDSRYQGYTAQVDWTRVAAGKRVPDPQEGRAFAMPWEWRSGEKTLEMCRHECLQHPECVGIEFCGPDQGGKHACDSNECILLSSTIDGNPAAGWNIFTVRPSLPRLQLRP